MALKCGIIGLSNTGKTTLFNCVANTKIHNQPGIQKSHMGQINVPDARLYVLNSLLPAQKVVHATVDLVDIPGLTKGSGQAESTSAKFLAEIQQTDALFQEVLAGVEMSSAAVREIRQKMHLLEETRNHSLQTVEQMSRLAVENSQEARKNNDTASEMAGQFSLVGDSARELDKIAGEIDASMQFFAKRS